MTFIESGPTAFSAHQWAAKAGVGFRLSQGMS
jgi:hypothetical protein